MKYVIIAISLVFFTMAISNQAVSETIAVMSYNIRLDNAGDNENNWHKRKAEMVDYIKMVNPAFLGVQEAIGHQLRYLDAGLQHYAYTGVGRDDGIDGGEYSAILYDSTQWQMIESNTFWLSATPNRVSRGWDAACHRVVTYGLFKNEQGQKIAVLNTHFDHVGQVARRESLRLINQFITDLTTIPTALMGDFNFTPDDDNYLALTSILHDTYKVADIGVKEGTYNGFGTDENATRRIDYILTNDHAQPLEYQVTTPKTRKNLQLSDHYPVIANVQIQTP